jgi:hypothetical protein
MIQNQRPEGFVINIRPVEGHMQHHGSGSGNSQSNGTFSNTILLLSPNATELVVILESLGKGLALVDAIVCVVCLHNNPMGQVLEGAVQLPRIPVVPGRWGLAPRPPVMKNMYESVVSL